MSNNMQIGDKVQFDINQVETFKQETSGKDKAIQNYQKLVLGGVDQIGTVKGFNGYLTTVSYPDGWDLPVPNIWLLCLRNYVNPGSLN